jgi:hypothetical protein
VIEMKRVEEALAPFSDVQLQARAK